VKGGESKRVQRVSLNHSREGRSGEIKLEKEPEEYTSRGGKRKSPTRKKRKWTKKGE